MIWKPWKNYEVSDTGLVRKNGKLKKPSLRQDGYLHVGIVEPGLKPRKVFLHRLVLEAFVGPRPEGMQCRHIDGNPLNNNLSNLCWGTQAENEADKIKHGTHMSGTKIPSSKLNAAQVVEIRRSNLTQRELARIYGVGQAQISRIKRGVHWISKDAY